MSRAFISNISHFLDESGVPRSDLKVTAQRLLNHLSVIIDFVSSDHNNRSLPYLQCFAKTRAKRCKGKLDASIELPYYEIIWHCLLCGTHGRVSRWKGTVFDKQR